MKHPFAKILSSVALGFALSAVAGCSFGIRTDPNAYPFPSEEIFQPRTGLRMEVVNGYPNPAQFPLPNHQYCDAQQFTETAAAIMRRELAKKGVAVGPGADRKVVLRVVAPSLGQGFGHIRGLVSLEATFGSTTITVEGEAHTGGDASRVFNAALVRSVAALLKRPELQAYLQGS